MMPWSPLVVIGSITAVLVSGLLRGFTGFGFALAATPLLSLLVPPRVAVPIVLILQVGSCLVGIHQSIKLHDRRSTRLLSGWAFAGTPIGILALAVIDPGHARMAIALACLAAAILLARGLRFAGMPNGLVGAGFGLCAGVLGGLCAMPGPPVLAYYMAAPIPVPVARASMILVFLATGLSALILATASGMLTLRLTAAALLLAPGMIAGILAGNWAFRRAPEGYFRPVGIIALTMIAILAMARALLGH